MRRSSSILLLGAVVAGLAAGPANGKPTRCSPYRPNAPAHSFSGQKDRARKAPVLKVSDSATADDPLVVEYDHGPSVDAYVTMIEDTEFVNLQIVSTKKVPRLNVKQVWDYPSPHDFDLYLYRSDGYQVGYSGNIGPLPFADPWSPNSGAGYESIPDEPAERCDGFTIESKGFATTGATVRLEIWLSGSR